MTDFDERLRARLERLDAAIPAPRPPAGSAVEGPLDATAGARPSGPGRKRKVALLLAAAALLVATSVVTAERVLFPDVPQPALEVALEEGSRRVTAFRWPMPRNGYRRGSTHWATRTGVSSPLGARRTPAAWSPVL